MSFTTPPFLTSFALRRVRGVEEEKGGLQDALRPQTSSAWTSLAWLPGGGAQGRRGGASGSPPRLGVWSPLGHAHLPRPPPPRCPGDRAFWRWVSPGLGWA